MACPSRVGKGFEAMGGGAQELRDRCEIPIALLRVDMPEVDRQVGEQRLHVQTLLIPALHPGHREGMAQRGQARGAPAMGWRDGHAPAQPCEPVMEGTMLHGLSPFLHENSAGPTKIYHLSLHYALPISP